MLASSDHDKVYLHLMVIKVPPPHGEVPVPHGGILNAGSFDTKK